MDTTVFIIAYLLILSAIVGIVIACLLVTIRSCKVTNCIVHEIVLRLNEELVDEQQYVRYKKSENYYAANDDNSCS